MISGDWISGSVHTDPETGKVTDDRQNIAQFIEKEVEDTAKTTRLKKVFRKIVSCTIKVPNSKFTSSFLVKENSEKHLELMARFPNAWKDFVSKGGGFGLNSEKMTLEPNAEVTQPKNKDPIAEHNIKSLKEEYEALEDKRSKRGIEIRAELKKLEG